MSYLLSNAFKQLILRHFLPHLCTVHPSPLLLLHLLYYYHVTIPEFIGVNVHMLSQEEVTRQCKKIFAEV